MMHFQQVDGFDGGQPKPRRLFSATAPDWRTARDHREGHNLSSTGPYFKSCRGTPQLSWHCWYRTEI